MSTTAQPRIGQETPGGDRPARPDRSGQGGVPVHPLIAQRWSPRGIDPDAPVTDAQLRALFEAARWAASAGNTEPVRWLVGRRGGADGTHERLVGALSRGNSTWAPNAPVLVMSMVTTHNDKGELPYAMYDAGQAGAHLALQAFAEGLVAHPMAGFKSDVAAAAFELPETLRPVVVIAIGALAPHDGLAAHLHEWDTRPRTRLALDELVFTGSVGAPFFTG